MFFPAGRADCAHDVSQLDKYEILLGDMRGLKWVQTGNSLDLASLGATPVEGGYENDHTRLYIARAFHKGAKHPGKVSERLDGKFIDGAHSIYTQFFNLGAYIPFDGKEKCVKVRVTTRSDYLPSLDAKLA